MESGPNRATLLHIGYDTAMMNKAAIGARTYREERTYVSTSSRLLSNMHGRHWSSFIVGTIACIGEITFWVVCILRQGTVDVVCGSSLISVLAFGVVNLIGSRKEALLPANRHKRSVDVPMEQLPLSGTTYIRLLGLDVLAAAQQRLSHKYKRVIPPEQSLKLLRKKMVHDVLVECMTTHFLFGAVPIWISLISSLYSWFVVRQDYTLSLLLVLTLISKTITCLALAVSSFHVRISQKLGELEIRRLEADIRTCPPEMIHRITPRFKALLHEAHMCGNLSHKFVIQCVPVILVTLIQFVGGVFGAANVNGSTNTVVCVWGEEEEDEEGTEDDNGLCVPMWMFFATGQCLISMLIWVHGFALLNLAIERDVDRKYHSHYPLFTHVRGTNTRFARVYNRGHRGDEHQVDVLGGPRTELVTSGERGASEGRARRKQPAVQSANSEIRAQTSPPCSHIVCVCVCVCACVRACACV